MTFYFGLFAFIAFTSIAVAMGYWHIFISFLEPSEQDIFHDYMYYRIDSFEALETSVLQKANRLSVISVISYLLSTGSTIAIAIKAEDRGMSFLDIPLLLLVIIIFMSFLIGIYITSKIKKNYSLKLERAKELCGFLCQEKQNLSRTIYDWNNYSAKEQRVIRSLIQRHNSTKAERWLTPKDKILLEECSWNIRDGERKRRQWFLCYCIDHGKNPNANRLL